MGMTIGKLIVQRDNFKVDETYQRPPDAWSNKDKQCFIDKLKSAIKNESWSSEYHKHIIQEYVFGCMAKEQNIPYITPRNIDTYVLSYEYKKESKDGGHTKDGKHEN